jgi:hypothetical protein
MAHIFKYAVLMAVPDRRRGERVNVGIMVFLEDRVDVRFAGVSKIGALAGGNWRSYADDLQQRLSSQFASGEEAAEFVAASPRVDAVIEASELAPLSIGSASEYESTIDEILNALVVKPRLASRPKSTRINTEIAREFRRERILAHSDEPIESHKVVRDFMVEDELKADFALRNGVLHVMATLDLRRPSVDIKEATLKAVVLDRAKEQFGADTQRIGVYAAGEYAERQFKTHIELLTDYSSGKCFNWHDARSRQAFSDEILRAYGVDRLGRFF